MTTFSREFPELGQGILKGVRSDGVFAEDNLQARPGQNHCGLEVRTEFPQSTAVKVKRTSCRWDPTVVRTITVCYAEFLASRVFRTVRLRAWGVQGFCKNAAPAAILEFNETDSAT